MKKIIVTVTLITLLAGTSFAVNNAKNGNEKQVIKKVIQEFISGYMNNYDTSVIKKFLHPYFNLLSIKKKKIEIRTFSTYLEYAKKMKHQKPEGSKAKAIIKNCRIKVIEYIGFAKFEVYIGEKIHRSEFITLLKFDDDWKFIRGVSQHHGGEGNIDLELEKEKLKRVISTAVVDGSGNYWDIERFKKGFHPVFTGFSYDGEKLEKDTYADWERVINAMKVREPEGHKELITGKFPVVMVLGNIGFTEVKLYYGTKLVETVYLLLLKYHGQWMIVTKLDIKHNQKEKNEVVKEKNAVMKVIQKAYVDGIQNLGRIEEINKGFHPDFALLYVKDNKLNKLLIKDWIKYVKQLKEKNPDGPKVKTTVKFLVVDVIGKIATAKFEVYRDSKLIFTDIMSLLKFDEIWRIVSKISHRH